MKEIFSMYAAYLSAKNKKIVAILDKLSNDEREKDRGSYYKSISGLYRHASGFGFFIPMIQAGLDDTSAAKKFTPPPKASFPYDGALTEAQWKEATDYAAQICRILEDFVGTLSEADLQAKAKWFDGSDVPVYYILSCLTIHSVHHQGQLAEILDEMKIENDYSGIEKDCIK